jgi:DNA-binding MarR family transcriptional regulator
MTTTTSPHADLVTAIEDMARAQRESGAWLARTLECGRGGLSVIRILDRGPRQVGDIAHLLRVDVSVASRQVAALAEAGLVDRDVPATDRRARTVALTDAGRTMAARARATAVELASAVFADWDDADVATATAAFRQVADAIVRHHVAVGARPGTETTPSTPTAVTPTAATAAPESPEREIA